MAQDVHNPGSVSPADQVFGSGKTEEFPSNKSFSGIPTDSSPVNQAFGHGLVANQPAPGGPLPVEQRLDQLTLAEVPDSDAGAGRHAVTTAQAASAADLALVETELLALAAEETELSALAAVEPTLLDVAAAQNAFAGFTPLGGVAPAVGSLVRGTGVAGQYTTAQGNTAPNASALYGTYVGGTQVIKPLGLCFFNVPFNETPTKDAPFYASAATAGKYTCLVSSLGLSPVGIVLVDTSVGPDYRATVMVSYQPGLTALDSEDAFKQEALANLGGAPGDWRFLCDDFNKTGQASSVTPPLYAPTWGLWQSANWIASSQWSCVTMASGGTWQTEPTIFKSGFTDRIWKVRWRCGWAASNTDPGYMIFRRPGANQLDIVFAIDGGNLVLSGSFLYATLKPWSAGLHTMDLECDGQQRFRWRCDFGTWSAWYNLPTAVSVGEALMIIGFGTSGGGFIVDEIDFGWKYK